MHLSYIALIIIVVVISVNTINAKGKEDIFTNLLKENNSTWTWPKVDFMLKRLVDGFVVSHMSFLRRALIRAKLSSECEEALFLAVSSLRKNKPWIIKMIDATGKVPSGILDGTVMDFGSFDECLSLQVTHVGGSKKARELFRGKYCMVGFHHQLISPFVQNESDGKSYEQTYGVPPAWIADSMKSARGFMKLMAFWLGICIPSSCSIGDLQNVLQLVSEPLGFKVSVADCQVSEKRMWKSYEIVAVSILGCLFAFVIIGSITDVAGRTINQCNSRTWVDMKPPFQVQEYWLLRLLKSFSFLANTERLLKGSGSSNSLLSFMHGIRFLSATWIILGHTYFFVDTWMYLKYRHLLGLTEKFNYHLPAAVIENFTIPVGSFFFISGFLMTYTNWTKLEKNDGKINLLIFFFHKFWRMTPALGLTIILLLAMPLIGSGPLWYSTLSPEIKLCTDNWWKNMLYVNNFWRTNEFCLIHTWYLGALMQFHIVGIVLLLLLFRWPVFATLTGFTVLITSSIWVVYQVVAKNFPMPALGHIRDEDITENYHSDLYIKPYAHVGSYLIGMVCGFVILKYRHVKLSLLQKSFGWIVSVSLALFSVYGLYSPSENVAARASYIASHRIMWALAVGWLTFCCSTKTAGLVSRILSWSAFQPLGQLSYLAYLLHPLVILYKNGSLRERVYYSHSELVYSFLINVVVSFFLAFLCYVTVELPFSAIEAMILAPFKTSSKKSTVSKLSNGHPQDFHSSPNIGSTNVHTISFKPYDTNDPEFASGP